MSLKGKAVAGEEREQGRRAKIGQAIKIWRREASTIIVGRNIKAIRIDVDLSF
jgi:hypothetical protein